MNEKMVGQVTTQVEAEASLLAEKGWHRGTGITGLQLLPPLWAPGSSWATGCMG